MVTSAGSCGTGEIEGVATVELVCVGGLLRMGGESLLQHVWRSVGVGFIDKEELDALGQSGKLPDSQKTSIRWEEDRLGWGVTLPRVSAKSTWWMDTAECQGVVGQRKLFSVATGKRNMSKVSLGLG